MRGISELRTLALQEVRPKLLKGAQFRLALDHLSSNQSTE
jgi:hypothetical protein